MTALDRVLPTPRKLELSSVVLALTPERAWELVRHEDLARSSLVKVLFALRALPSRFTGRVEKVELRLDAITSSAEHPGFQILIDEPREVSSVRSAGCGNSTSRSCTWTVPPPTLRSTRPAG